MKTIKLSEGLHNKDLEFMVRPTISLDEYVSKIDVNAIVLGFYCADRDSANDLNRFVQRCPVNLLDSEVSLSPNSQGEYMVFVEFLNNDNLKNEIKKLLEHLTNLVQINIDKWQLRYKTKKYFLNNLQLQEKFIYNNTERFNLLECKNINGIFINEIKNGYLVYEKNCIRKVYK